MSSPPYAVCRQGVHAVRKYFHDLKVGSNQRFVPVTVIGKSQAGKTSIVRSIQQNKRVLTARGATKGKLDEATKVFQVSEAKIDETSKILFVDHGGQAVYHFAYQLTSRTKCVPLLVVDIEDFDRIATQHGVKAACEELCMEWLSHLYISCPQLGPPVVVLTHRDKVTDECFKQRKQQLVEGTEKLRRHIIDAEMTAAPSGPVFSMTSFADSSKPLIVESNILDFSKESSQADIETLKQLLTAVGSSLKTVIPGSWYSLLLDMMEKGDQNFILLSEIDSKYPDDPNHVTLQYLHDIRRTMWFREIEKLSKFVFHRAEVLTSLIETLYSHIQEDAWGKRLEEFIPFQNDGRTIEKGKYQDMVKNFRSSGVMEAALLLDLLEKESSLRAEIAIELLKAFHLIHECGEPTTPACKQRYIIPYFATRIIAAPEVHANLIPLKVDLNLHGLPLPSYVFTLITAAYLDKNSNPYCLSQVGTNGTTIVHSNGVVSYLIHDVTKRRVTLLSLTPVKEIGEAWTRQMSSLKQLVSELKAVWKAVRYESVFFCSHCLLQDNVNPDTTVDPEWFQDLAQNTFNGHENFMCISEFGKPDCKKTPRPLMFPCKQLNNFNDMYDVISASVSM